MRRMDIQLYQIGLGEGTKARPNGPDLRSGFAGIQGFESLPSHILFHSESGYDVIRSWYGIMRNHLVISIS